MKLPNIDTITFDMDDTLWDFQSAMERALEITLERLRVIVPSHRAELLTVQDMMDIRDGVADELGEGAARQEEIRYKSMARTLEYVGSDDAGAVDELYQLYWEARIAGARPFDDAPAVLDALKDRFRLGIISNGNNTPQMVGLDDVFQFTVFAHECGYPKPDRRIFEFALGESRAEGRRVAHVGDNLGSDVLGANNYGLLSVWLNRNGSDNDTQIVPAAEIRSLTELLDIL